MEEKQAHKTQLVAVPNKQLQAMEKVEGQEKKL